MRKRSWGMAAVAALTFVAHAAFGMSFAEAATHQVSPGENIQAVIDAATPGDTIEFAAGSYTQVIDVNKELRLTGAGSDPSTGTVFEVAGTGRAIGVSASNVTLDEILVDKGDATGEDDGRGLEVTANVTNLTLEQFAVTGATNGFRVGSGITIDGLVVTDSHFDDNDIGWYLAKETAASAAATVTNVAVTNTTFDDNLRKGLYAEKLDNALFDGGSANNSGTSGTYGFNNGVDINLKFGDYENIEFRNFTVTGSGLMGGATLFDPAAITIKARDDGGTYGANPATLTGVTLTNVIASGGVVGVRFGESGKNNAGPTNVAVSGSSLSGTGGVAFDNQTQAAMTATGNWWGQSSGPGLGQVTGTSSVTTTPWCTADTCATQSNNADLTGLSLSSGTLSPAFNSATTVYTANVDNSVNSVTVNRTTSPGAALVVAGSVLNNVGDNTVTVTVTSADGSTQKVYTITVNRAAAPPPPSDPTPPPTTPPTTAPPTPPTTQPPVTTPPTTVPSVIARPPSDPPPPPPPPAKPDVVSVITTPSGNGTIQVTPSGEIISTGDAPKLEGVDNKPLNAQIVGATLTPSGQGAWLVGADGGVFTTGDATFHGSAGALKLNAQVVGIAPTPSGKGYILVGKDGGVFTYGDAKFHGSLGAVPLNKPAISASMSPTGKGYWVLAEDGGVFSFGDAKFHGSGAAAPRPVRATSLVPTSTGNGYWLIYADGVVVPFGDAK